jgi:uncharacterized cofD-like protein
MQPKRRSWLESIGKIIRQEVRWFVPGIGIKRWLVAILAGTTFLGLGFAVIALNIYRTAPDTWWLPILSFLSLRFLDRTLRAIIFGLLGIGLVAFGLWGLGRSLLIPFVRPGSAIVDTVSTYRRKEKGPRIVALGGGNGLSTLLRGLKAYSNNISAIVTVADDGGSSGEIRRNMGILPPGDIRNCLAALSDDEAMLSQIFQYRFSSGAGLNGHSLGNLLITALADISGSFEQAVAESGKVLAIRGQVLPSTLHNVSLVADVLDEITGKNQRVHGESEIPKYNGSIQRVWLEPDNPAAYPPAIQAILSADLIIIGPGSLYTSILPDMLVPEIAQAIRASRATKFYVCNVATQPGETDHFTCGDHLKTLEKHLGDRLFDLVICNNRFEGKLGSHSAWVRPEADLDQSYSIYQADLIETDNPWRHHSTKLARAIIDLYNERTGPLVSPREDSTQNG